MSPSPPPQPHDKNKKAINVPHLQASIGDTLAFVFECGPKLTTLFALGCLGGILSGLVYPALSYLFSTSFTSLSGSSTNGLGPVREMAYKFMVLGVYGFFTALMQTWCFEIVAFHSTLRFRLKWLKALLRQDAAYFDVNDVAAMAGNIGPSSNKYRRGLGRKFGEGIQYLTMGVGGLAFAFYSSWQVALVVLAVLPFCGASAMMVMHLNQTKGARAAVAYKNAGGVAYSAVSAIKTVLSLNAVQTMIDNYSVATLAAYRQATAVLIKQGFFNGMLSVSVFALLFQYQSNSSPNSNLLQVLC
jgi:ATP-binding cassette, subfamily B (MDR/TAP), member 1